MSCQESEFTEIAAICRGNEDALAVYTKLKQELLEINQNNINLVTKLEDSNINVTAITSSVMGIFFKLAKSNDYPKFKELIEGEYKKFPIDMKMLIMEELNKL